MTPNEKGLLTWAVCTSLLSFVLFMVLVFWLVSEKREEAAYIRGSDDGELRGIKMGQAGWRIVKERGYDMSMPPPPKRGGTQYTEEDKVQ